MKCVFPEISWHNRDPVLSLDVHSETNGFYRLATSGADCHVLVMKQYKLADPNPNIYLFSDMATGNS